MLSGTQVSFMQEEMRMMRGKEGGGELETNIRDSILNIQDTKSVVSVDRTSKRNSAFDEVM
jgi:hypothetical protein